VGLEEVRSAVAPRALTGVAVEDGVELSFRFEVADGEVVSRLLVALVRLGAHLGDGGEVRVGVRGLAGRARAGGRQRGVDRTESTLPLGGLPQRSVASSS